jgi:hypothetical protein
MLTETAPAALVAAWSADVYVRRDVKPPAPLLGPLARGCVALLTGPRGVGKSWLALALAHTAARGGTLASWRAKRKQRVVFIDAAGSEAVLHERLLALGPDRPPPSLVIVPGDAQPGGLDLASESGRKSLDDIVTDADLVVVDGLSALVRKGRGVGARWAALEDWLRSLRRRHTAVLLVDAKDPKMLADLPDIVLKVERPADGVKEADLRLQVRQLSSRPAVDTERFELRMTLRRDGAAWTRIEDIDHRAVIAYRLDRADYTTREIARLLDVSPATGWRLVMRGARLPPHLRDGVDLDVPIPPRPEQKKRDWAKILRLAALMKARENLVSPEREDGDAALPNLLPREKGGPAAQQRRDEGPAVPDTGDAGAGGESASPDPLPRERVPSGEAEGGAPGLQTHQTGEAVKQSEPPITLDTVPTDEIVALCLARRRHWKQGTPPPRDRLAAFSYEELFQAARARLSARGLNRRILEDDGATQRPLSHAERQWRTPLHALMKETSVIY